MTLDQLYFVLTGDDGSVEQVDYDELLRIAAEAEKKEKKKRHG